MTFTKLFIVIASISAGLIVILGAFGSHVLKNKISPEMLTVYQSGIQYHMFHSIGLFVVALVAIYVPNSSLVKWSGWIMLSGIVFFSGSLYILSITGIKWIGIITPFGGVALIISWILLAISAFR
ncbi:MAG: DUF423 domain-containing protein [Spirochaetota bacterium]|nr:DUF423 domain-containing protein [Spirochaetota bacterium]